MVGAADEYPAVVAGYLEEAGGPPPGCIAFLKYAAGIPDLVGEGDLGRFTGGGC